ncbi:MAG: hypothetical protein ACRBBK_03520 [Paracoccaceae bacterium]
MPFIIALIGILAGAYFWMQRARNASHMAGDLIEGAKDLRLAARRFGFRRQANVHPVESIEDPRLAVAGLASAFMQLSDLPTQEERAGLENALRDAFELNRAEAEEMLILGQWLVGQSGGASSAISRLGRKLQKLSGAQYAEALMQVIQGTLAAGSGALNDTQRDALEDIRRHLRL